MDLCGVEGDGVLGEFESLLDEGCEFADSSTLLAQDFLGVSSPDDCMVLASISHCFDARTDICDGRSDSDFDSRVAFLSEFSLEELVQLCVEDTIGNELPALGDSTLLSAGHCGGVGVESEEWSCWICFADVLEARDN